MKRSLLVLLLLSTAARAETLTCPDQPSTPAGCTFHYHVAAWNPDTDSPDDLYGLSSFPTLDECTTARTADLRLNVSAVNQLLTADANSKVQTSRFGPCHCDMTLTPGNPLYLKDSEAKAQREHRAALLGRMRQALVAAGIRPDSEVVKALNAAITSGTAPAERTLEIHWSSERSAASANGPGSPDGSSSPPASTEAQQSDGSTATESPAASTTEPPTAQAGGSERPAGEPAPAATPTTTRPLPAPTAAEVEEAADSYVNYEVARVQEILKASNAVTDDALKSNIFEAAMQRLQMLSNLRAIATSPGGAALQGAMAAAHGQAARLALVKKLFGAAVASHWAPSDARDAIVEIPSPVSTDPMTILHDEAHPDPQRRLALYAFLSKAPNLEASQELWLAGLIDNFLSEP
jgi:hypothetical protein